MAVVPIISTEPTTPAISTSSIYICTSRNNCILVGLAGNTVQQWDHASGELFIEARGTLLICT